ncbi:phage tail protein [Paramagnetospirillum kuznetsovii]|uniref:Phage tail protein n=1 Tax=Paramagnetospirillum kuznetsovii TaxID=2053833 RepID=A0A364P1J0_9PROT|nr:phage tail protein [Paramagnetospirillum kuznetsovii]RAU22985.1 phage tail protein [Paramagnetospirillum kuznetsovii]
MTTFALITEGITDQIALELILEGHYRGKTDQDIDVEPLQPTRDATDQSRLPSDAFGGWELVLEYCSLHDRIHEALAFNDYLVIQIDTDCGEEVNYGVPLTIDGAERAIPDLVEAVRARIIACLSPELHETYKGRILFAICVHSLECWLLPLHERQGDKKRKTHACADKLQRALARKTINFAKDYDTYRDIALEYRKANHVARNLEFNESFAIFINDLPVL